jgi:hypothetical protein
MLAPIPPEKAAGPKNFENDEEMLYKPPFPTYNASRLLL